VEDKWLSLNHTRPLAPPREILRPGWL